MTHTMFRSSLPCKTPVGLSTRTGRISHLRVSAQGDGGRVDKCDKNTVQWVLVLFNPRQYSTEFQRLAQIGTAILVWILTDDTVYWRSKSLLKARNLRSGPDRLPEFGMRPQSTQDVSLEGAQPFCIWNIVSWRRLSGPGEQCSAICSSKVNFRFSLTLTVSVEWPPLYWAQTLHNLAHR